MTDVLILLAVAAATAAVGTWVGIVLIARPLGRALDRADDDRGSTTMSDASGESAGGD
jgi:hypothetical protein